MAALASAVLPMPLEAAHSSRRPSRPPFQQAQASFSPNSFVSLLGSSRNLKSKTRRAFCCVTPCGAQQEHQNEAMKIARKHFYEEITFRKKDANISLAKAALLIAAEDEAYLSSNKEKDMLALHNELRCDVLFAPKACSTEKSTLEGMTWLAKLDSLATEVQQGLGPDANHLDVLKALRYLTKKSALTTDPNTVYLHHVLEFGAGTAILLAILCIETCQRLGLELHGAPRGDDFILWPSENNSKVYTEGSIMESQPCAEMIFEPCKGGKIWSQNADIAHGFSDLIYSGSKLSTTKLEPVSNRAIITILLRNMKQMYWKRATKAVPGTEITAPLQPFVLDASGRLIQPQPAGALLRPHDLRLAVAASEKILLLQPHDWITRRDHGLLLYHSRRYGEALQELSICMAVAPVQEVQILEPFVEKLHLLRIESSWASSFGTSLIK